MKYIIYKSEYILGVYFKYFVSEINTYFAISLA